MASNKPITEPPLRTPSSSQKPAAERAVTMATATPSTNPGATEAPPQPRSNALLHPYIPVNANGSFEFDRVIKTGKVQKRGQKTRTWKSAYLVLRPNALSIYKTANEEKLRHKIYLTDLTAVASLRDPKNKRDHLFGLYTPARNFYFQAPSGPEAEEWLDIIRTEARIDEEDQELLLASPFGSRQSSTGGAVTSANPNPNPNPNQASQQPGSEVVLSSSPECIVSSGSLTVPTGTRHISQMLDSSGFSGNEILSHSDYFSDSEAQPARNPSMDMLSPQPPPPGGDPSAVGGRPSMGNRNISQGSGVNIAQDLDRVIWQGKLQFLKAKGGVRQWKKTWAVLRPRNLILYRDESEYKAKFILPFSSVVNAVDIDPLSKSKAHCLQIITEEKTFRFCAEDEEALVQCLGAFKSLLTKRRELENRLAAKAAAAAAAKAQGPKAQGPETKPTPAAPAAPACGANTLLAAK